MKLYHATPRRNLKSISRRGLLTAKSKGRRPVVWLHSRSRRDWAIRHTKQRHGTKNVAIVSASASRHHLRRAGRGLWYSTVDVPPGRLTVEEMNHENEAARGFGDS
jgi:RNA:NAD 2'-phosphotransferase (TPT1/KptA family)